MSPKTKPSPTIAVLISGGGTTLKNLIEQRRLGILDVEIAAVISSNPTAVGLDFARAAGIPIAVVDHREFEAHQFSVRIFEAIEGSGAKWAVLGGFLRRMVIDPAWSERVINIHPSLIPAFSGRGFYGERVHQAVLDNGCKITGCTVHFVDNQYDHGPIIAQLPVEVLPDDSTTSLAGRVFAAECRLYPVAINALAAGSIRVQGRTVIIDPPIKLK